VLAREICDRVLALDALADCLAYPDARMPETARVAEACLRATSPAAAAALTPFAAAAAATTPDALEELFARTFDWSTTLALEIGWHLYGEQYERGAFLVRLRERLRATGVEEGADLPDHLGTCLRLLGRLPADEAVGLASAALVPAVDKILAGFGAEPNPYMSVIRAVSAVVSEVAGPLNEERGR